MTNTTSEVSLISGRTVGVCDTQPIAIEGLRALANASPDRRFVWSTTSLKACLDKIREGAPDLLLLDKAFGMQAVMDVLHKLPAPGGASGSPAVVVWGSSMTEAEALRLLQGGARGIFPKTASVSSLEECFASVLSGGSWIEPSILTARSRTHQAHYSALTQREQQVKELVEQGLKNSEIARELGIRPGTVKIHLKHIFEKTGVRGRHSLALAGFTDRPEAMLAGAPPQ